MSSALGAVKKVEAQGASH